MSGLVIIGDTLLDIDIMGPANRLCPDAPVPVIDVAEELVRPGGAGLAARLARADGADVVLVTSIAEDADGRRLRTALGDLPVVASIASVPTSVKTRIRSADRSLVRLDRGGTDTNSVGDVAVSGEMLDAVADADAILVADYGRGLAAHPRLRAALCAVAAHTPVVWDPHPRGPAPIPGAWLVTPNLAEARAATDHIGTDHAGTDLGWATTAARQLRQAWCCRAVALTLGSRGAVLDQGGTVVAVPAPPVAVLDPCGAGDRFAVTAAICLLRGRGPDEAVEEAVRAAAQFLAVGGVSALDNRSTAKDSTEDALGVVARTRTAGGLVVATGGCFDLLHTGHLRTLQAARALGDCLVVCLNSDSSVRGLKGPDRPINQQTDRAALLTGLRCVDAVAVFDADTPIPLLRRLRPDVWVKGGDYTADGLPETEIVREWGGATVVVPYHAGRSTTRLAGVLAGMD